MLSNRHTLLHYHLHSIFYFTSCILYYLPHADLSEYDQNSTTSLCIVCNSISCNPKRAETKRTETDKTRTSDKETGSMGPTDGNDEQKNGIGGGRRTEEIRNIDRMWRCPMSDCRAACHLYCLAVKAANLYGQGGDPREGSRRDGEENGEGGRGKGNG